jgi:chromosome segregation protein
MRDRQARDLDQARAELEALCAEVERDTNALAVLSEGLSDFEPRLASARQAASDAAEALRAQETALSAWQDRWHAYNLDVKEQQQARTVEETRLEHLEAHRGRLARQLESVEGERQSIDRVELEARLAAQRKIQSDNHGLVDAEARALESVERSLVAQREAEQRLGAEIEHLRGELESRRGRLDTLRAIQNAALGNDEELLGNWLSSTGLGTHHRLVQELVVDPGWSRAVETVLGDFLQAICVDDARGFLGGLPDTSLVLLEAGEDAGASMAGSLAGKVEKAGPLAALLSSVRCAPTLDDALNLRSGLAVGESVITPDGIWLGLGWVRVSRGQRFAGMVAREQEIRELSEAVADHEARATTLSQTRTDLRREIERLEQGRLEGQARVTEANRQNLESASLLASLQQELERAVARLSTLEQDSGAVQAELDAVNLAIGEARTQCESAVARLQVLETRGPDLRLEQEALLADYNEIRAQSEHQRGLVSEIQIDYESRRTARAAAASALERIATQQRQLHDRIAALTENLEAGEAPLQGFQLELDAQLAAQLEVQQQLTAERNDLTAVELSVKTDEGRRHDLERQVNGEREAVEGLRMEVRELEVRRETLAERFVATGANLEEVLAQLPAQAPDADQWDQRLAQVRSSIERLGPINLAAIDEFSEQSERKTYLDAQHADLSSALETLEHAIRRIDRETRTRFQETFDNINAGLKRIFPRLFGGGHAYLTLEGEEVLSSGVTVMARPPGKRNSHIHLLSGGEKALTAVALIFSIFELNPAPFCILDEVDAPLDEANVGRFCDIVREMSATVQFIVITHNKTTMEMARQLTGVTMNEPGVSRLVAVDIDEAVKLAAS